MAQSLSLSLLVLVLALYSPGIQGSDGGAQDCCLKYSQRTIPANIVRGYRKQEPSLGCPFPAILFIPRKRSQPDLCADPKEDWVQQLMQRLDKRPVSSKGPPGCGSKSGKKRKGSKGCKRNEKPMNPKGPQSSKKPEAQEVPKSLPKA